MHYRIHILVILFFTNFFLVSAQEEWMVPDDKKNKLSPFEFTQEIEESGSDIYSSNCASCHGNLGQNNFVPLVPPPGDPASDDFQENTDGELYHKIRSGKGTMPSFNNTLTPDEVWNVVAYIRSSNNSYVQEVAKEIERGAYDGDVSILLTYLEDKHLIEAKVTGTKGDNTEAIEGAGIVLQAERLFGNLQIDEDKLTNKNGIALFDAKTDLPGNAHGNIKLIAKLSDQEAFGLITSETLLPIGIPTNEPSLVAERAMWNKMRKAPLWVLFTYGFAVLSAWSIIFYVLFQLKKIFEIGKVNE